MDAASTRALRRLFPLGLVGLGEDAAGASALASGVSVGRLRAAGGSEAGSLLPAVSRQRAAPAEDARFLCQRCSGRRAHPVFVPLGTGGIEAAAATDRVSVAGSGVDGGGADVYGAPYRTVSGTGARADSACTGDPAGGGGGVNRGCDPDRHRDQRGREPGAAAEPGTRDSKGDPNLAAAGGEGADSRVVDPAGVRRGVAGAGGRGRGGRGPH